MEFQSQPSWLARLKTLLIGRSRDLQDRSLFHKLSLVAFFAWVGLGADGLSSSCYGPAEAFLTLGDYHFLGIFVALGTAFTIMVISMSYSQTIELFPSGGGGYLVASKLHSPFVGMISGCALLIDYVLTISISIASGADAMFSFLPLAWQSIKLPVALLGVMLLMLLNLRGVKESVLILAPIFITFVCTHLFVIVYSLMANLYDVANLVPETVENVSLARSQLGLFGLLFLIMRAYSMGAGTFTGIEAVSNGLPILREPRVRTGKRTMRLMATSLAGTALGLMIAFFLYQVSAEPGKTLNAVLFDRVTASWGESGYWFVFIALLSEAALLFVAAQAGFIDGPRILANMALDRWMPTKFSILSDRFVTKNGIFIMGLAALLVIFFTHGQFELLIVLYSINVFITFILTESGMVRHWWQVRHEDSRWFRKLSVNGISLILDVFILSTVVVIKFHEGGWITLLITGTLIALVIGIRRHYNRTYGLLRKLDDLVVAADSEPPKNLQSKGELIALDAQAKTAVLFVNGYNGLGLHVLFAVQRLFEGDFKNFVFVQVGIVDAGNFKGAAEIDRLKEHISGEVNRYVQFMHRQGYGAEGYTAIGIDVVEETMKLAPQIMAKYPRAVFFGGQLAFLEETFLTRLLHNNIVFAVQRKFYHFGIPFFILPIRV